MRLFDDLDAVRLFTLLCEHRRHEPSARIAVDDRLVFPREGDGARIQFAPNALVDLQKGVGARFVGDAALRALVNAGAFQKFERFTEDDVGILFVEVQKEAVSGEDVV